MYPNYFTLFLSRQQFPLLLDFLTFRGVFFLVFLKPTHGLNERDICIIVATITFTTTTTLTNVYAGEICLKINQHTSFHAYFNETY